MTCCCIILFFETKSCIKRGSLTIALYSFAKFSIMRFSLSSTAEVYLRSFLIFSKNRGKRLFIKSSNLLFSMAAWILLIFTNKKISFPHLSKTLLNCSFNSFVSERINNNNEGNKFLPVLSI